MSIAQWRWFTLMLNLYIVLCGFSSWLEEELIVWKWQFPTMPSKCPPVAIVLNQMYMWIAHCLRLVKIFALMKISRGPAWVHDLNTLLIIWIYMPITRPNQRAWTHMYGNHNMMSVLIEVIHLSLHSLSTTDSVKKWSQINWNQPLIQLLKNQINMPNPVYIRIYCTLTWTDGAHRRV